MDLIITYVDGSDPAWQADYLRCVGGSQLAKRYRDWGTLPYLLRGIGECMPFVSRVFLVVARESQVPAWINRDTVRVVHHADFMPARHLPTFSASAIEMFLHRIDGLGEEFLYFNDDCFPLLPCEPTDFFRDGRAAASLTRHFFTFGHLFRRFTRASDRFARRAAGAPSAWGYVRPQHACTPMLRSVCAELYDRHEREINDSVTPLREPHNFNQYVYTDYAFFTGHTFSQRISNRHISLGFATASGLAKAILNPQRKMVCINDVELGDERFQRLHAALHAAFERRFPHKSRFEI